MKDQQPNNDEQPDGYTPGYCKPPKHSQFKPGQSGNPKGRPKKTKDVQKLIERELDKSIKITEQGESKRVTVREAFVRTLINGALNGDRDARRLLLAVMEKQPDLDGLEVNESAEAMLERYLLKQPKKDMENDNEKD